MTTTRTGLTYGGNRASGGNARNTDMGSWSAQKVVNTNTSQWKPGCDAQPSRICPTCGLEVRVKVDGQLGSHRVGTSKQRRWLCPGEDSEGSK